MNRFFSALFTIRYLAVVHVTAKPSGAVCNPVCKYCFFLSEEALYLDER